MTATEDNLTAPIAATDSTSPRISLVRCFLAGVCSHLAAPYAAARLTIRYQLQGDFEQSNAIIAGVAMSIGLMLAWQQLVALSPKQKLVPGVMLLALWIAVSFALIFVAAHSEIPTVLLGLLWTGGSLWIAWTVWAWSFFQSRGVLIGSLAVGVAAVPFWLLVEAVGLRGDTRVEFAWRKTTPPVMEAANATQISSMGKILWSGYLGDSRSSTLSNVSLDTDWESHPPRQLWLQSCGKGWSSFAVTETSLFSQEQLASGDCVTARSLETGKLLWSTPDGPEGFRSGLGGDGPRATPTVQFFDSSGTSELVVYAVGPAGSVCCLNATDGSERWRVDLMQEFPGEELIHGVCGSPLVIEDLVIVSPPSDGGPCLAAFDRHDGSVKWRCDSDWRASYSSPALMTIAETEQILLHAGPGVLAVDPKNGRTLWQHEFTNEHASNVTQPMQVKDTPDDLFLATGYQGGITRISVSRSDDGSFQVEKLWETRRTMRTRFSNIVQFGDVVVGLDDNILCAVDINSGKRVWKKSRYGHGQLLKAGDLLLVLEEKGDIRLLKPDAKGPHSVTDSIQALDRKTWAHPVVVGNRLIIRNDQEIVCLQIPVIAVGTSELTSGSL